MMKCSPDLLWKIAPGPTQMFFIAGAPKCATTSVHTWLEAHPNIYMPKHKKEPNFFNNDMTNRQVSSEKDYLHLFDGVSADTRAVGEASVWYLYSDTAIDNILDLDPTAKFIVGLRDPVTMVQSYHLQLYKSLSEDKADFWDAWTSQAARAEGLEIPRYCDDPRILAYKNVCSLGSQLERLLTKVPREQVLWYFMEEVGRNPAEVYRRILAFLGVPKGPPPKLTHENKAATPRSMALHMALKSIGRMKSKMPFLPANLGLMAWVAQKNKKPIDLFVRAPLSEDRIKILEKTFFEEKSKLTAITGVRFS